MSEFSEGTVARNDDAVDLEIVVVWPIIGRVIGSGEGQTGIVVALINPEPQVLILAGDFLSFAGGRSLQHVGRGSG